MEACEAAATADGARMQARMQPRLPSIFSRQTLTSPDEVDMYVSIPAAVPAGVEGGGGGQAGLLPFPEWGEVSGGEAPPIRDNWVSVAAVAPPPGGLPPQNGGGGGGGLGPVDADAAAATKKKRQQAARLTTMFDVDASLYGKPMAGELQVCAAACHIYNSA